MYNKDTYKKINDKKVLHKVKKQWVTISLALLMMIGGGAVATHISANADTTANAKPQVTSNASQSNSASSITSQAKALHNNMVRNASLNQAKPTTLSATDNASKAPKVVKTAKWDNANVNYYNNDVMELIGNGTINAKDVPANLPKDSYGDVNNDWTLKIDKANANINLDNSAKGGEFSGNYNPIWNKFKAMNLSGLHTNNVTNMNSMFEGDEYLQKADLSGFNTNNVTNMDYMFSGDTELSSLDLSNFDTRKASMTKFFNQDNNLMALTLGNSTKLNSAFKFLPMNSIYNNDNSDIGDFYSSDDAGTIQASQLLNYYPINKNSTLLVNDTYGTFASILINANGDDVTSRLQNNSLPAGKYYIAKPVSFNFITQLPQYNSKYSDTVHKGVFYPLTNTYSHNEYDINPSSINFNSQITNMLANDKTYYHDYTLASSDYQNATADPSRLESDGFPAINIKVNLNVPKYLNDANNNVKSYLDRDTMYQNELHDFAPYESSEINNSNEQSYNNDVKQLNSDYTTTNHNLTEPSDANTVMSTSSADNWANSTENDMASNLARYATTANRNRARDTKVISQDKPIINTTVSDIHRAVRHPYFDMNKLNASAKATLESANNVANSASDALKASNWNPTYNNMNEISDMMEHTGSALNNINQIVESAQSNSATSANSSSVAPSSKASSANSSATSKASSVTPSSTSSNASSKASSKTSSNASQSIAPSSKASAKSSQASSNASQSVKPSSNSSATSNKASSSVAPSSTSSNASSEASSSANSSVSSQSSNQSSATSQNSNNSSSVAPSSEQQSSDNNADNTPFVPSFNVPTTPTVTPTQNTTVPTNNDSSNNSSSVAPSVEPQTTTNNSDEFVNNPTKPTVNKHHNSHVAYNHSAKHASLYLSNTSFKGLSKRNRSVVTTKGVRAYKRTRKGRYVPVMNIKPNTKLAVKQAVKYGKATKLQLANGLFITSDKRFVKIPSNKRVAKRRYYRYLSNYDFKGLSKRNRSVVALKGVWTYRRNRKGKLVRVVYAKRGTKLAVSNVIRLGKGVDLRLKNGRFVTADKRFVSVKNIAKRTNKRTAKRAIKGIDASRYTRALRKSNYVLRHGRRHATRYIYRKAKKFNKANNAEKKAYRKFARKHTNRNRKAVNKAITKLSNLVSALLK